jgi:hypothetical protein
VLPTLLTLLTVLAGAALGGGIAGGLTMLVIAAVAALVVIGAVNGARSLDRLSHTLYASAASRCAVPGRRTGTRSNASGATTRPKPWRASTARMWSAPSEPWRSSSSAGRPSSRTSRWKARIEVEHGRWWG